MIATFDERNACQECCKGCEDAGDLAPLRRATSPDKEPRHIPVYSMVWGRHGTYYRIHMEAGTPLVVTR